MDAKKLEEVKKVKEELVSKLAEVNTVIEKLTSSGCSVEIDQLRLPSIGNPNLFRLQATVRTEI